MFDKIEENLIFIAEIICIILHLVLIKAIWGKLMEVVSKDNELLSH